MSAAAHTDAIVVGAGPNGLSAAVLLAQHGYSALVLEASATIGGGTRTAEITLPGYRHDVCSAVHPMGILSPFFKTLPLADHGLSWIQPPLCFAHPLDDEPSVTVGRSVDETAAGLRGDGDGYRALLNPLMAGGSSLFADLLGPLRLPRHPIRMALFALRGLRSAVSLSKRFFREPRASALLAGCAAHAILPLDRALTGGIALMFAWSAHLGGWPIARGGSQAIADALASYLRSLGGTIVTDHRVTSLRDLPPSRVVLFDISPRQLVEIAGQELPPRFTRRLERFRYGPGVFKLDWALSGPIPWEDPACASASTVHLGGTMEEIASAEAAVSRGEHPEHPFVLVTQQSHFDSTRAPPGKHTGYAYCHVPYGSPVDVTNAIEGQIERFAPGFRDLILGRARHSPAEIEQHNPTMVGGVIGRGVADLAQFFTRPVARLDPYSTPNPRLFLCSASTPPGGGVHGMAGYFAARSALRRLKSRRSAT